jgi:hypothetical protein
MGPRLRTLALCVVTALVASCEYEVEPIDVPLDLGVPDLAPDFALVDYGSDGPVCPNGLPPRHGSELSDPPLSRWLAEALAPISVQPPTTTVTLDTTRTIAGAGSLRLDTANGNAGLVYPNTRDGNFDLSPYLYVSFSVTADDSAVANDPGWQGAQPHFLLVTDTDDYFEYIPAQNVLPRTPGAFLPITVPIAGGFGWARNQIGTPDLTRINYLALTFDSWGAGFTVWIDDMVIGPGLFLDCGN